ncbi:SIR2 family protein [Actinomycetospora sp. TBRC 11914]|uniref:SIR2 family NAD-dependent protein deacylase n=1 Tax=Actinomycetospora sp. TBRC 11914 TaxID=2729387 RepID=UPI00145DBF19|nr:SIR2 family protein [Actinomycetospora sp. TBRC 11914]NMO90369.1 SIR2 family protein [Actinomycetospora sp. TBRC 11914]
MSIIDGGDAEIDEIYDRVARVLRKSKTIPVLGAGANLCGRPKDVGYVPGEYLPSGVELASLLARSVGYPDRDHEDLARVSQFIASTEGPGPLYDELHEVFDLQYSPTVLHRFLARLARHMRLVESAKQRMLFITTNYDHALEQAFQEIDEPFDLLTYIADGNDRGRFRHQPHGGVPVTIEKPDEYLDIDLSERHLIAKIHGAVEADATDDSYVITEDHYVDYISRAGENFFPVTMQRKLVRSHFLFLGYSLRDWNFRVMLYRLWGLQNGRGYQSWAIDANPDPVDRAAWKERGVEIVPERLESFVKSLELRFPEPSDHDPEPVAP